MSDSEIHDLPEPSAELRQHSDRLKVLIRDEINKQGAITFDRFMQLALYSPGLGYYSAGLRKFGEEGDFITAPEVSRVFSWCLANQCREIMHQTRIRTLLEFGAGSGRLAADLLFRLEQLDSVPDQYLIIETSADLRQRQKICLQQELPELFDRVKWLDELPDEAIDTIIIANEVLDAMPCKRITFESGQVFEQMVTLENEQFIQGKQPLGVEGHEYCDRYLQNLIADKIDEYQTELHVNTRPWLNTVYECMAGGVMLFLDYGYSAREYYSPDRANGTLLCHYRHRVHDDVFYMPGLQDITASVNFNILSDFCIDHHMNLAGYTTQSSFLIGCGLDGVSQALLQHKNIDPLRLSNEIRTLTMPGEMGERFRVMALMKNIDMDLCGFSFRNLLHQL